MHWYRVPETNQEVLAIIQQAIHKKMEVLRCYKRIYRKGGGINLLKEDQQWCSDIEKRNSGLPFSDSLKSGDNTHWEGDMETEECGAPQFPDSKADDSISQSTTPSAKSWNYHFSQGGHTFHLLWSVNSTASTASSVVYKAFLPWVSIFAQYSTHTQVIKPKLHPK